MGRGMGIPRGIGKDRYIRELEAFEKKENKYYNRKENDDENR